MKRLLYFLREENYVTVRKNDVNKAFMLLYEKYSSFIFLSYFTPHHPFQWVKYSSNQKIIWSSASEISRAETTTARSVARVPTVMENHGKPWKMKK